MAKKSKKSKTYWQKRQKQWYKNQDKMDARAIKKLELKYKQTSRELEKEIAGYFQRYGKENVLEFRTMLQDLSKLDRDLLYRDMEAFALKHPEYEHLLPVRESIYKLNRLQGLHYSSQLKLLELGAYEQETIEKHLIDTYGKQYASLMAELGLGHSFVSVQDEVMYRTIYTDWVNDENFSDRIWKNKEDLRKHLQTKFRDSIARGDDFATMTREVSKRFDVGTSDAQRLVTTEANFVFNQSHKHAYTDAGVKEYEIAAIEDSRTSNICRNMDGQRFRFDEMIVGENYPPFHPRCRTTVIGVLE